MNEVKHDIKALSLEALMALINSYGQPAFRAKQIFHWIYAHGVTDFAQMKNLSASFQTLLSQHFTVSSIQPHADTVSHEITPEQTVKFLFRLSDEQSIESVFIPSDSTSRNTLCISSQVGCAFACKFCATGYMGFIRNLTIGEILDQVLWVNRWLGDQRGGKITNVVFMGMGEPLANFDNCLAAIRILTNPDYAFQISTRKITVSTVGFIPGIQRLIDTGINCKLAISLHSAHQAIREELIPIAKEYSLATLKAILTRYNQAYKQPITFEYSLIHKINDSEQDAILLSKFCKGINCKINLIDYNSVDNIDYLPSPEGHKQAFIRKCIEHGLTVTVRKSRGADIQAACGQLAIQHVHGKKFSKIQTSRHST
ncbi:radical SAM enzyme, Cfr family [Chloroherpeton thalassium ATCC 35110]|uniref:Probable dual-specificity RNA methyltransferase RlmN n=1 Tax=Chloroherpeton thalassium (strain ATCC 35110 / GB-78) TaxID=517418 RepID=RLMN_CHLT3|nr:23S rRNA (adenine(2503)-C(2))-methyltransferase RlmN [Chloroherpeton thalassium]B3QS43.1 RecName: Full=Probable dual-specificity RNA methyltransferase RlmN; AltName: Full=23S rRNA (adenine(2503)-C(2))-methyltransferase; AltName: Full=23S rRNA m2A2503 methyltransferase; AltName: Full=Ribosomal RNA large subunit methyltransferase N; AltName: Full=tRNA (adenine(37)-C(2))-methyltransferase; AltName: Full=tRNA m2A37 methyltransferase [Chloroherpeton thalassium ATCC 35110]ACF13988.1 radical SAM enzy